MTARVQLSVNADGCDVDALVYCGAVTVTISADQDWDAFVAEAVAQEWVGVEALSGVSGDVGETVVANAAAFGQSVADTVASVKTWDQATDAQRTLAMADCEFTPNGSRLSRERLADGRPRFVPLTVDFLLKQGDLTVPIQDAGLAELLGVAPGERAPLAEVRNRILARRR